MLKRLYLGEGPTSQHEDDKIRIDIVPQWADVVADLNDFNPNEIEGLLYGKPVYTNPELRQKFSYIEAHHIFEHIESTKQLKKIMQWCYDILEPEGIFDITVPYWHSESAVECIEHVRFFNENSFMNYYSNPYAKEMNLPQFELLNSVIENHLEHKQVHVRLKKI
jgi:hypothetical protein